MLSSFIGNQLKAEPRTSTTHNFFKSSENNEKAIMVLNCETDEFEEALVTTKKMIRVINDP